MRCIEKHYKIELTEHELLLIINAVQNYKDYKIEHGDAIESIDKLIIDLHKFY